MKFLMMIKYLEQPKPFQPPKSMSDAIEGFVTEGFAKGWLKRTAGLKPSAEAWRIRSKGGGLTFTDGPFTEAKEIVGGFALVETPTREEAAEIARRFMELHRVHIPDFECESEVRPFEDFGSSASC